MLDETYDKSGPKRVVEEVKLIDGDKTTPLTWRGPNLNEITHQRNLACPSYETELIMDLYLTKTSVGGFFHTGVQFRVKWI